MCVRARVYVCVCVVSFGVLLTGLKTTTIYLICEITLYYVSSSLNMDDIASKQTSNFP